MFEMLYSVLSFFPLLSIVKKLTVRPGAVTHSYKPRYSGGRDQEDGGLRPFLAKKLARPHLRK
jgi:hypothetical protein